MNEIDWKKRYDNYRKKKQKEIDLLNEMIADKDNENWELQNSLSVSKKKRPWKIDISYQHKKSKQDHEYVKELVEAGLWHLDLERIDGVDATRINSQILSFKNYDAAAATVQKLMDAGVWYLSLKKED